MEYTFFPSSLKRAWAFWILDPPVLPVIALKFCQTGVGFPHSNTAKICCPLFAGFESSLAKKNRVVSTFRKTAKGWSVPAITHVASPVAIVSLQTTP